MPKWKPCKRRFFIKKLVKLGFNAPEPGDDISICDMEGNGTRIARMTQMHTDP